MSASVLITGISGFTGRHLAEYAAGRAAQIYGLSRRPLADGHIVGIVGDLCEPDVAAQAVQAAQPDYVFHLAAQTPATAPQLDARDWLVHNPIGTLHLLEAVRLHRPQARVLVVSSSAVYGHVATEQLPIGEEAALRPITMYGVSKATQELLAIRYAAEYGMHVVRARPFNLLGPGEPRSMLTSTLAAQVADIAAGRSPAIIRMRHRATSRDFTDIRDAVRAYWAILEHGAPGEVYNVCSGIATPISEIVDRLLAIANVSATVEESGGRIAARDILVQAGSHQRLVNLSGWQPQIDLGASLVALLESFYASGGVSA